MKAVQVREGIYWVGAIDWNIRNFHGYETPNGTTYNAYLILDEKVTLIDTVKAPFTEEMIERIESVISLDKIDVIISNHVEMDHSGGLPVMMEKCPKAEIITSMPSGIKGLQHRTSDRFITSETNWAEKFTIAIKAIWNTLLCLGFTIIKLLLAVMTSKTICMP